jgi:hypothetical protein
VAYIRLLLLGVIAATYLLGCVEGYTPPISTTRHYTSSGIYVGKSIETRPGHIRHYDQRGKFLGTSNKGK